MLFCINFNSSSTSEVVLTLHQLALASKRSRIVQEQCPRTKGYNLACTCDRLSSFLMYSEYWSLYCSLSTHDGSFVPGAFTGADGGVMAGKAKSTMARRSHQHLRWCGTHVWRFLLLSWRTSHCCCWVVRRHRYNREDRWPLL